MALREIVSWSNANSGAVMSVLTAVYVLATLLILLQSRRSADLQAKALKQAAELEVDRLRPRILATLEFVPGALSRHDSMAFVHVTITNIGPTAAVDVLVRFDPELVGEPFDGKERRPAIINCPLSLVAPHQRVRDLIDGGIDFMKRFENVRFAVNASYKDVAGKSYSEQYEIDLEPLGDIWTIQDPSQELIWNLSRTAESAEKALSTIAEALSAPDRSNLMMPFHRDVALNSTQRELLGTLQAVQQSIENSVGAGFAAYHVVDRPKAVVRSLESDHELEAASVDLEYLIRAGYLHGRYEGRALRFWVCGEAAMKNPDA